MFKHLYWMSKLKEYEKSITEPLRQATILLLIRGDEVLPTGPGPAGKIRIRARRVGKLWL